MYSQLCTVKGFRIDSNKKISMHFVNRKEKPKILNGKSEEIKKITLNKVEKYNKMLSICYH